MAIHKDTLINVRNQMGIQKLLTIEEWYNLNNTGKVYKTLTGSELIKIGGNKVLDWDEENKFSYKPVRYIIRHKISSPKWRLKTATGQEITVTEDHSLVVFRNNQPVQEGDKKVQGPSHIPGMQLEVKPRDVRKTDKVLMNKLDYEWYKFNKIESCKNLGEFEDEYVYDIEMADDSHTFIANDILIHNGVHKEE